MLPWLGEAVHAAPFGARVAAYTGLWVGHQLLTQTVIWGLLTAYNRLGLAKKNTRDPSLPVWRMLYEDLVGYVSWTVGVGVAHAYYNPTPADWDYSFSWMRTLWYQLPILMAYDTLFFFVHRYFHINKWLFRHVHAKHHRNDAYLDVTSNSFEHPLDGLAVVGIPVGLVAWLGLAIGNWWMFIVSLHTIACIFVFGHSGYEIVLDEAHEIGLLLINPMLLIQLVAANRARPVDHEDHHTNPRVNFALFFTFWDDLYGCAQTKQAQFGWRLWPPAIAFYVCLTYYYEWVLYAHPRSFFALLAGHALGPLSGLAYALLGGALARAVTKLPIWDVMRREYLITYAPAGQPGAFEPDTAKRYIFCYQPMGIQARGAWYTFAGRGREGPASRLNDCKLAVGRVLWALPAAQPVLALFGCCASSYRSLKVLLTDKVPKSVCVTLGGFREAQHAGTYATCVATRRGYARLALETGAALVPVVGVGEPHICGRPAWGARVFKLLVPYRPRPIRVVFGAPVEPAEGEGVEALHARYVAALLALGKEHGVPLTLAAE